MRPMRALRTLASRRSALVGGPLVLASLSAGVLLPASAAQAQQSCVSPCLPTSVDRLSSDPLRQLTSYLSLTPAALLSPSSDDDVDDVAEQAARDARLAARRAAAERAAAQRAAAERAAAAAAERAAAEQAAAQRAAAERAAAERAAAERAAAAAAERTAAERASAAAAERTAAERTAAERAAAERTAAERAAAAAAAAAERTAAERAAAGERAAVEQAAVERTQTGAPMPSPLSSPRTGPSPAQEGRTRANPGLVLQAPAATNSPATGLLAPAPSDGQPETAKQAGNDEEPLAGYSGGAASRDDVAGAQTDGAASSGDAGSSTAAGSTAAGSTAAGSTAAPRASTGPSAATQAQSGQAASASTDTTPGRSVPLVTALIGGVLVLLLLIAREIVR